MHWSFSRSLWPKQGIEVDVKKSVGTLKRIISKRHGNVQSIQLWRSVKAPQNLLDDDKRTLEECGFVGRGKEIVKSPLAHLVKGPPTKVAGSDDEDEGPPKEEEEEADEDGENEKEEGDEEEDDVTYVPPSDDEDVPEEYDSEHGEEFDDSETPSLEGMFFRTYGKGYLLTPPADSEYFGVKYFLDGWWMPKFNSWFFKHDHWEQLEELGATFVSKRSNKSKSGSARSGSKRSGSGSAGSKRSGAARSIRFDHDFSGMSFTKYGKGFILTCDENDRRHGTAYLVDNSNRRGSSVIDGGFWNSSANGWFFKKTHFDFLVESGAQFIKSEDDFVTSDTQISVRPKFTRYGKGWLLMSDETFPYDSSRKYFENGWYMPAKKAWFFKTCDKNAFIKKFS